MTATDSSRRTFWTSTVTSMEPVQVRVVELLRPQQVFAGLDDLVEQLHRDVDAARTALA